MKRTFASAVVLALACLPVSGPDAAAAPGDPLPLAVPFARLELPETGRPHAADVVIRFRPDERLLDLDPATDALRAGVGPVTLAYVSSDEGTGRLRTPRPWRWSFRERADGRRVSVDLDARAGRLRVRARGIDLSAQRAAGARDVPVWFDLGGLSFTARVDFRTRSAVWTHRGSRVVPPPGDGGGGPLTGGVLATFDVLGETYRIWVSEPATVAELFELLAGRPDRRIPVAPIAAGPGVADHNAPWSWHVDGSRLQFGDLAPEVCDGTPSIVEADVEGYLRAGWFCPWASTLVEIDDRR